VLERIPVGIVMAAADGKIHYANPYFCTLVGLTLEELEGVDIGFFRAGRAGRLRAEIRRLLRSGEAWHAEIRLQTREREPRPMFEWSYPLQDDAGRVTDAIHFFHDLAAGRRGSR
jgi:PAS domain S-box-containing protein